MRSAPGFVTRRPPPPEWQERLQRLDENLWIAWNDLDPNGPRWGIVRWHGRPRTKTGVVLIDKIDHDNELVDACMHGWAYIGPLQDRDGNPCDLTDEIIAAMHRNDWFRTYGNDPERAADKLQQEQADLVASRKQADDALLADAFADMKADHVLSRNATSGLVTSGD